MAVDAFSISWSELKFYAFLAFSLTETAIPKVSRQQGSWIMIIARWKTQFLIPRYLSPHVYRLYDPKDSTTSTELLAVHLLAQPSETQTFQKKLQILSQIREKQL